MDSKAKATQALKQFITDFRVPEELKFGSTREQTSRNSEFMQVIRKFSIDYNASELYKPQQNLVEGEIHEVQNGGSW
jgi:hypothetical protein